jgi:hypothetical protein
LAETKGFEGRVKINDITVAYATVSLDPLMQANDLSNSEGKTGKAGMPAIPGFRSVTGDVAGFRITIEIRTWSDLDDPFALPLSLDQGDYVKVEVFPLKAGTKKHSFPSALLVSPSHRLQIPGTQPVTLVFESDGFYALSVNV